VSAHSLAQHPAEVFQSGRAIRTVPALASVSSGADSVGCGWMPVRAAVGFWASGTQPTREEGGALYRVLARSAGA